MLLMRVIALRRLLIMTQVTVSKWLDNLESQINLRVMWMDEWVKSKGTQDSQQVCTKLFFFLKKKLNF